MFCNVFGNCCFPQWRLPRDTCAKDVTVTAIPIAAPKDSVSEYNEAQSHFVAYKYIICRFYAYDYDTRFNRLPTELEDLKRLGRDAYVAQCVEKVESGARSQEILAEIKTLKKELWLCQFKTISSMRLCDVSLANSKAVETEARLNDKVETESTAVPDWIKKMMEEVKPLTPLQKERVRIQAESSVLTLAGRRLSTSCMDTPPRYHEFFRLYNPEEMASESVCSDHQQYQFVCEGLDVNRAKSSPNLSRTLVSTHEI